MIGICSCCKRIRWIYKNKCDSGYSQTACWECYKDSVIIAKRDMKIIVMEEKLEKIKEVISRKNGISDNQEFGLTYCQAIDFLDEIEDVIKHQGRFL